MVHLSVACCVLALASAQSALALSAHSPQDLFAYPQYRVAVSQDVVLNQTATVQLSKVSTAGIASAFRRAARAELTPHPPATAPLGFGAQAAPPPLALRSKLPMLSPASPETRGGARQAAAEPGRGGGRARPRARQRPGLARPDEGQVPLPQARKRLVHLRLLVRKLCSYSALPVTLRTQLRCWLRER